MTIAKTSTGIFTGKKISGRFGKSEIKELKKSLDGTLEGSIQFYEDAARRILKFHKIKLPYVPMNAEPYIGDAAAVILDVQLLRRALSKGDAKDAAIHALHLGEMGTRMLMRPHEKPVVTGRKNRAFLAKRREAKKRKAQPRIKAITDTFQGIKDSYGPDCPKDAELYQEVCDNPTIKRKYPKLTVRQVEGIIYRAFKKTAT